jgi:protein-S-isoprenylcysteine O-methyltransferase Ste14
MTTPLFPPESWAWWVSGAIWICFFVYWSAAARDAAPAKTSETSESRSVHTRLLLAAFLLLLFPFPYLTQRWLPDPVPMIGLAVQVLGLLLAISARRHLGRNWSGNIRVAEDHQLVRSGPYRVIRHPIYSAMLVMFLGTSIADGTAHSIIGTAILFAAYARKIRLEEETLRGTFGDAYDEYRKRTWALIPFLV